jgi:hypothetical protein
MKEAIFTLLKIWATLIVIIVSIAIAVSSPEYSHIVTRFWSIAGFILFLKSRANIKKN